MNVENKSSEIDTTFPEVQVYCMCRHSNIKYSKHGTTTSINPVTQSEDSKEVHEDLIFNYA